MALASETTSRTRMRPPHFRQRVMSMAKQRARSWAQNHRDRVAQLFGPHVVAAVDVGEPAPGQTKSPLVASRKMEIPMTTVNKDYYRFCLSFPYKERRVTGTLWLVENRNLAFMGDQDHVRGTVSPTILPLDTDGVDEDSVRRAFLAFDPTYHLIGLKKTTLGYAALPSNVQANQWS